jgi:hypothetical protein
MKRNIIEGVDLCKNDLKIFKCKELRMYIWPENPPEQFTKKTLLDRAAAKIQLKKENVHKDEKYRDFWDAVNGVRRDMCLDYRTNKHNITQFKEPLHQKLVKGVYVDIELMSKERALFNIWITIFEKIEDMHENDGVEDILPEGYVLRDFSKNNHGCGGDHVYLNGRYCHSIKSLYNVWDCDKHKENCLASSLSSVEKTILMRTIGEAQTVALDQTRGLSKKQQQFVVGLTADIQQVAFRSVADTIGSMCEMVGFRPDSGVCDDNWGEGSDKPVAALQKMMGTVGPDVIDETVSSNGWLGNIMTMLYTAWEKVKSTAGEHLHVPGILTLIKTVLKMVVRMAKAAFNFTTEHLKRGVQMAKYIWVKTGAEAMSYWIITNPVSARAFLTIAKQARITLCRWFGRTINKSGVMEKITKIGKVVKGRAFDLRKFLFTHADEIKPLFGYGESTGSRTVVGDSGVIGNMFMKGVGPAIKMSSELLKSGLMAISVTSVGPFGITIGTASSVIIDTLVETFQDAVELSLEHTKYMTDIRENFRLLLTIVDVKNCYKEGLRGANLLYDTKEDGGKWEKVNGFQNGMNKLIGTSTTSYIENPLQAEANAAWEMTNVIDEVGFAKEPDNIESESDEDSDEDGPSDLPTFITNKFTNSTETGGNNDGWLREPTSHLRVDDRPHDSNTNSTDTTSGK